jgi:hypothetical protein
MVAELTLVPNPAGKYMNMIYTSPVAEKVTISIMNISGQVLEKRQHVVNMGINTMQAPVGTLAAGVYTLTIKGAGGVQNRQFIKY